MPRKLKTYQTSVGFFDLAIAAPSMKAAAEAWGSQIDVFRRGFASETHDPTIVNAKWHDPASFSNVRWETQKRKPWSPLCVGLVIGD